jgi:hypothetical protein
MKSTAYRPFALVMGLSLVAGAASADGQRWLHVKVHEETGDRARVSINLPVTMIEAVAPLVDAKSMHGHHLRIDDADVDGVELRRIWQAMRTAGDGNYVTVDSDHDNVRVKKQNGFMLIQADDRRRHGDRVEVKIPVSVVDALFSGATDEEDLNIAAAMRALANAGEGEFVTVTGDDATVRIWVDGQAEMAEAN